MKERQVEKLTPDMVGMEIGVNGGWCEADYIGIKYWIRKHDGQAFPNSDSGPYTIRDPKEKEKLPSERLDNVFGGYKSGSWVKEINAILDELWRRTEK
jgi:hypothetical protein